MLFNSYIFILVFLPILLVIYYLINKIAKTNKPMLGLIIIASFIFYAYNNYKYLLVLIASILANWCIVSVMRRVPWRKLCMIIGIVFNVGLIFYFKYYDFFISNFNEAFKTSFNLRYIALPLGISFFTFQQISFVVDSYNHETDDYNLLEYAAFVCFFPQLVAGPIVLHDEIIPQFRADKTRTVNWENMSRGVYLFAVGLFKKVLIADTFGKAVDWGYVNLQSISNIDAMVVILSYTIQMYFDFSGYCDMASGIAYMMNIKLPINFDSPYKSLSIVEYWQRWHITLSRFLRKYIYFPLGGSKKGTVRTYVNIMIIFIISGFWHGANWTFVIWGTLHGVANCLTRLYRNGYERLNKVVRWLITFLFVDYAFVIFRAPTMSIAREMLVKGVGFGNMRLSSELVDCFITTEVKVINWFFTTFTHILSVETLDSMKGGVIIAWLGIVFYMMLGTENAQRKELKYSIKSAVGVAVLLVWAVTSLAGVSTFLYFNF